MGILKAFWHGVKKTGAWIVNNPDVVVRTVDTVETWRTGKKPENVNHIQADKMLVMEQRMHQLSEKTEKLDRKMEEKTGALHFQIQAMNKQLRTLRIWLTVTGVALALAVVAIALFAFWI